MLYAILKPLIQITVRLFFKNYQVNGKENIPENGPFLFAANHPATFMDAVIIAATLNQKVYFLAKSTAFKSRFAKWFLPKLNMIPVYRKQDDPSLVSKNADMFEKCFEHLAKKKSLLIFPEGVSLKERKIKEVKSGAARIAFGAYERNHYELDIKVVCIGLNYSNNGKFQSNVLINIGESITLQNYVDAYKSDPQKTVKRLTHDIKAQLEELTVSIEENDSDIMVSRVEEMYKVQLMNELKLEKKNKINDFYVTKAICNYLAYFKNNAPEKINEVKNLMDNYYTLLEQNSFSDKDVRNVISGKNVVSTTLLSLVYSILTLPLFLAGLVANYLPYFLSWKLSKRLSPEIEYRVAIAMIGGMFIFIVYYIGFIFAVNALFHMFWLNIGILIGLPITGLFAFKYYTFFTKTIKRWRTFTSLYKKSKTMLTLINKREQIIEAFSQFKSNYEQQHASS